MRFLFNKEKVFPLLIIFIALFAAYSNSFSNDFLLDDHVVLFGEQGVVNKTVGTLFTGQQHLFYRPVGHLFLMLCSRVLGAEPVGYHVANLLLFFVIGVLFFRITDLLFHDRKLAFLAALLYCIHPINSMLVNYVTANIISTFVITLQISFLLSLKYCQTKNKFLYGTSLFFFVLALFSHEMAMVFPAYIFCAQFFVSKDSFKQAVVYTIPYAIISAAYFLFRLEFFSLRETLTVVEKLVPVFSIYISSVMELIYWYVSKLFLPRDFVFLWSRPLAESFFAFEIIRLAVISAALIYLIFIRWKKGIKPFGLAFFAVGFLPCFWACFAHFPFAEPIIEPHWFYFSSFGFFILCAHGLLKLKDKIHIRLWSAFLICLFAAGLFLVRQNNRYWKDQETYSRYWLSLNRTNMTPYYGLGKALMDKGDHREALKYFRQGLEISKYNSAYIIADIGYAHFLNGDSRAAQEFYREAIRVDPRYSVSYYYQGLLYSKEEQIDKAQKAFLKAKELYPQNGKYSQ